jgi:hypothetical protein
LICLSCEDGAGRFTQSHIIQHNTPSPTFETGKLLDQATYFAYGAFTRAYPLITAKLFPTDESFHIAMRVIEALKVVASAQDAAARHRDGTMTQARRARKVI